jgi:hypothetical protein
MSAFSPPKQTTWKGIDEIKAVRQTSPANLSNFTLLTIVAAIALPEPPACDIIQIFHDQKPRFSALPI